jgi:hypothetical protein
VLVLVLVVPTSPRGLKLQTSPRRLDSERLRQASREAMSGKLSSNLAERRGGGMSLARIVFGALLPRRGNRTEPRVFNPGLWLEQGHALKGL